MKIDSLKLAGLYSFGHCQEFTEFSDLNLFIGPNGSGKTNVLRVLDGLPFEMHDKEDSGPARTIRLNMGHATERRSSYTPRFGMLANTMYNRETWVSDVPKRLEINFREQYGSEWIEQKILFKDIPGCEMNYESGNVVKYANHVARISTAETHNELLNDLSGSLGIRPSLLPLLNFGIFYIFGQHFKFEENGSFVQSGSTIGGKVETDYQTLPSGVLQVVKLLTRILVAQSRSVLLIDEPELYLEPRYLRRFVDFLVWYCGPTDDPKTGGVRHIRQNIDNELRQMAHDADDFFGGKIPNPSGGRQVFLASHSPVVINTFLKLGCAASIYEFRFENAAFTKASIVMPNGNPIRKFSSTFSVVRKVTSFPEQILDGLGCRGSDLLQCNGVIWVEGPSDVIYIRKWLEMFASENKRSELVQGRDYEFQIYGGSLLASLCLKRDEEEYEKLVEMFSFSRNAYVVIDSDAVQRGDKIVSTGFPKAKKFIQAAIARLNKDYFKLGLWYDEENTEIRTIEHYLVGEDKKKADREAEKKNRNKKDLAQEITKSWDDGKRFADFADGLTDEIRKLDNIVRSWSDENCLPANKIGTE